MAKRIRHVVQIDEQKLLDWLGEQYRQTETDKAIGSAPVGTNFKELKEKLEFDPECSAIIGTSFVSTDTLNFLIVEIPAAKPKLRPV